MEILLILAAFVIFGAALWYIPSPKPRDDRGDTSLPYTGGDTSSSTPVHSDPCSYGHDFGSDGGGDCGGDGGGGGSD
ncbi:hypothetical protein Verru16b_03475 [Lacunisphaera limnophila]|uniref:Uncharacterized protein n=1 Tax=Lacunisphaera limnophila TaxID=1838286 RepID=A0A1D8AZS2_9BACT|nr:hypothetical protein Verru16b_03475 [Lacunisphaera limnophila]